MVWFQLTEAEANSMLEPYDPKDNMMPSYQHTYQHRYLKEHVYKWLVDNLGTPNRDWLVECKFNKARVALVNADKAMLFKLMWSGK